MKTIRLLGMAVVIMATAMPLEAQNTPVSQMEKLGRGLIALPASGSGMFVSWRSLGYDADDTSFELLRGAARAWPKTSMPPTTPMRQESRPTAIRW